MDNSISLLPDQWAARVGVTGGEALKKRLRRAAAKQPKGRPVRLGDGWLAVKIGDRGDWRIRHEP
jgi:hypothetical protein